MLSAMGTLFAQATDAGAPGSVVNMGTVPLYDGSSLKPNDGLVYDLLHYHQPLYRGIETSKDRTGENLILADLNGSDGEGKFRTATFHARTAPQAQFIADATAVWSIPLPENGQFSGRYLAGASTRLNELNDSLSTPMVLTWSTYSCII